MTSLNSTRHGRLRTAARCSLLGLGVGLPVVYAGRYQGHFVDANIIVLVGIWILPWIVWWRLRPFLIQLVVAGGILVFSFVSLNNAYCCGPDDPAPGNKGVVILIVPGYALGVVLLCRTAFGRIDRDVGASRFGNG